MPIFPEEVTRAVIYFIRNPLEISISFAHHSEIPVEKSVERINNNSFGLCIDSDRLYSQLQQRLFSWSEHVRSWTELSNLPVYTIRYEDMLQDPFMAFSNALDFINVEFTEDQIQRAINHSRLEILQSQEDKEGFREKSIHTRSFFRSGSLDTWKSILSPGDIKSIIEKNQILMEKFGYSI